jgi:hypothetical protein
MAARPRSELQVQCAVSQYLLRDSAPAVRWSTRSVRGLRGEKGPSALLPQTIVVIGCAGNLSGVVRPASPAAPVRGHPPWFWCDRTLPDLRRMPIRTSRRQGCEGGNSQEQSSSPSALHSLHQPALPRLRRRDGMSHWSLFVRPTQNS